VCDTNNAVLLMYVLELLMFNFIEYKVNVIVLN